MNKEEAINFIKSFPFLKNCCYEFWEIIVAISEGKKIQYKDKNGIEWFDCVNECTLNPYFEYRIKSETYIPFKDTEEFKPEYTEEQLKIVNAYLEGKEVQYRAKYNMYPYGIWTKIARMDVNFITFDWEKFEYRIKSETYIPFKNAKEFEPYRDKWIKSKNNNSLRKCIYYQDDGIQILEILVTYDFLFDKFTFEDGTPCGVMCSK